MAEQHMSSHLRTKTSRSQLTAEQSLTKKKKKMLEPTTKDTPHPKTKKPQDGNHNKIKSHTPQVGDPQKGKSLYHGICP